MAAFRPRTVFAAPIIITVAASCGQSERPRAEPKAEPVGERHPVPAPDPSHAAAPPEREVARWSVTMHAMKCSANVAVRSNPPPPARAIACPPGMSGNLAITVVERADGTCITLPGKHVTACPLPPGQPLVQPLGVVWTIERRGNDCHAEEDAHDCPPGAECNPPRPRTFPCPPGVTEEKPLRVAELPDATCVVVPDGCADTSCVSHPVACPPEGAR
jgi:hypothetical protein